MAMSSQIVLSTILLSFNEKMQPYSVLAIDKPIEKEAIN